MSAVQIGIVLVLLLGTFSLLLFSNSLCHFSSSPARTKSYTTTACVQHEQKQDPVSVFVIPHMERDYESNVVVKHLFKDGLDQSSVLTRSKSNLDTNLVWLIDPKAMMKKTEEGRHGMEEWCQGLVQRAMQAQEERRQAGLGTVWPIRFVDDKDGHMILRCELLEEHMGMENIYYHQRGVIMDRDFDPEIKWVKLGRHILIPCNLQFHPKPIAVRTDIVQDIVDDLQEYGGSFTISDAIETMPRDVDLSYFWEIDAGGEGEPLNRCIELRNEVYRVLHEMKQENSNEYNFSVGLTGDVGPAARQNPPMAYVHALLQSKIVVLAQRDRWEDQYRLFEALVAGPLVMTDKMLSLPKGLKDGVSIVEYTSANDLRSKVKYYLSHDQERIEVAGRGRDVAMSRHRAWHRLEEIVLGNPVTRCSGQECMTVNVSKSNHTHSW